MYTSIQSLYLNVKYYFETFFLRSKYRGNLDGKLLENVQQDPYGIQ